MVSRIHAFCFGLASLLGAACSPTGQDSPLPKRPPPLVTVAPIEIRDVPVEISAPIDLKPLHQIDVGSKIVGYVEEIAVDVGDRVKKGQLLALVAPADLSGQAAAGRGTLAQAEANAALAASNLERQQALAPSGLVSQQELEHTRLSVVAALAARDVTAATAKLADTRIVAPMDGVVFRRRLDPGALVGPTTPIPILTIVQTDTLRVLVPVAGPQSTQVRTGLAAHIELDDLPGRSFSGTVVRIAPALDVATRTLDVEVQLPNAEGALRSGMYGRASIVVATHEKSMVVPSSAVQITGTGDAFAYVRSGDRASRRRVRLGVDGGSWLEILEGLGAGDEILTAGFDTLSDNALIRVSAPTSSATPVASGKP